jgi:flagellar basal-body rod protein FlgB
MVTTPMGDALGRYMDLVSDEMKLTAANSANADTPGYHTLGMDFEAEFQRVLTAGDTDGTGEKPRLKPRVKEVDGLIERPDGNNVSMDREGMRMAEVQLKFRIGAALFKREMSTISEAIHVDK